MSFFSAQKQKLLPFSQACLYFTLELAGLFGYNVVEFSLVSANVENTGIISMTFPLTCISWMKKEVCFKISVIWIVQAAGLREHNCFQNSLDV